MKFKNSWFLLFIVYVFFTLISCAPIKRHQRLVEKYPFVHTVDTIKIIDTIRVEIPKIKVDTIFKINDLHDTITIIKDRLKIKMYAVHDSIYINGECDTITVEKIMERKIPVIHYAEKPKFDFWLKWIIAVTGAILIFYMIIKNIKNGEN